MNYNYQLSMIRNKVSVICLIGSMAVLFAGCSDHAKNAGRLPFFGPRQGTYTHRVKGELKTDTVYHIIPNFRVQDQDGDSVSQDNFAGKIYVADFFFTSCPSICPITEANLLEVQKSFENIADFKMISFSIDPRHDSVRVLKNYASHLRANTKQWYFVRGDEDEIDDLAQKGFMATAQKDSATPGGYLHSGAFMLIDKDKRVRGVYNGTDSAEVKRLIHDIPILFKEYGQDINSKPIALKNDPE